MFSQGFSDFFLYHRAFFKISRFFTVVRGGCQKTIEFFFKIGRQHPTNTSGFVKMRRQYQMSKPSKTDSKSIGFVKISRPKHQNKIQIYKKQLLYQNQMSNRLNQKSKSNSDSKSNILVKVMGKP